MPQKTPPPSTYPCYLKIVKNRFFECQKTYMGDTDGWAHIDEDLLLEISTRFFSYDDYIQLGLVCKEWRLKLPKIPNANNVPWLLIPEETEKNSYEDEEIVQLPVAGQAILVTHGLKERRIYHVMLPNMQMQNYDIRGSSHGWLIMVSLSEGTVLLLNPFTNVEFGLPHISTFPNVIKYEPDNHGDEYTLLDFPDDESYTLDRDSTHKIQLWKVVINSPPDCNNHNLMAAAIYGPRNRLAFYKPNDMRWVEFPTRDTEFEDVIFFGVKIYAVNHAGQLYEFDTKTKSGRLEGGIHEVRPPSRVDRSTLTLKYLIGCANGSLLMLVRHFRIPLDRRDSECVETYKFDIYELKKNGKKMVKSL
ncbi:hypothetical protein Ahy_A05g022065 [Arachis hypogaea]|uniref:KIB1-4 beta-propeller domain-containing protein n=2 Tax=Arachis TaxID=3817 RepID=A0A445CZE0_ARAHY|nr:hypothetical protein Ahy_A05g022065 [Arachis hypogaea]